MSAVIKDHPTDSVTGQAPSSGPVCNAFVQYGDMINGIPSVQTEPFVTIDEAIQFAGTLVGHHAILFIEYQGLKLGVNQ